MAGTCCATNSAASETTIGAAGVSSPNVPGSCESMRKRKGGVAVKPQERGRITKSNVTSRFGAARDTSPATRCQVAVPVFRMVIEAGAGVWNSTKEGADCETNAAEYAG